MRNFKDSTGREWSIEINVPMRKKVKADAGFDLFAVIDDAERAKLADPETLVAVVYSLCAEQTEKLGITPEQFATAMVGDALDGASDALMEALCDFFPSRQRLLMQKALAKGRELMDQAVQRAVEKIDAMSIDRTESPPPPSLKNTSTNSPELLGSTLTTADLHSDT